MDRESYSIIFKEIQTEDNLSMYMPVDVLKGFVNKSGEFISKDKKCIFTHIINNPNEYAYAYNNIIDKLLKKYNFLPLILRKKLILKYMQSYNYIFGFDRTNNKPIIIVQDLCSDNYFFLSDNYIEKYINPLFSEIEVQSFNIGETYNYIIKKINKEEENIKRILTILWKRNNNSLSGNEKNILVDGNDIETKIEIFKYLEEMSGMPVILTSITEKKDNELHRKDIEDLLVEIMRKVDGNYNKAINSVLLIDDLDNIKFDNLNNYESIRIAQNKLIELLHGKKYVINYNDKKILFDTSNLIIVSLCDFSKYKICNKIGFSLDDKTTITSIKNNMIYNGILFELSESFQTIIEIKNNSISKAESKDDTLFSEIETLLNKYGIKLELSDETENILRNNSSEKINKLLSLALFDIAVEPEKYEKLIITPETIEDNKKYTLVRKK